MRKSTLVTAWAGFLLLLGLLLAAPAQAGEGSVAVIGHFENGGVVAEIDTYTEGPVVVAVMALKANGKTLTFAFDKGDWPALEKLWRKAYREGGSKLKSIGSLAEVGTSEQCTLTLAAGPFIRLGIVSPLDGSLSFDIPPAMQDDFDSKLRQAAAVTTPS